MIALAERFTELARARSALCPGIDPCEEMLYCRGLRDDPDGLRQFCDRVLDAAADRVAMIKADYEKRRERLRRNRRMNPLSAKTAETVDDVYGIDEGSSSCVICHK